MIGTVLGLLGTILRIHFTIQDINYRNLVGMAVWYIGAGSGSGNPYGIVVATVRVAHSRRSYVTDWLFLPIPSKDCLHCAIPIHARCGAPPRRDDMDPRWCYNHFRCVMPIYMWRGEIGTYMERTVVGYSWIDTHLLIFSNSGVGVELGWRRA